MSRLDASQFGEFYQALHDNRTPFPWQERLARRVCTGTWPAFIALPTAAGKTSCIDIALFALACQAEQERPTAPRRIFFVVDRRVIVEQAFEHARLVAKRLGTATNGILHEVASRLRNLAGSDRPLDCFELRGGIYRDDAWARTPLQPTVIASTVDQVGSRLLFRGYGLRGGSARPIHAGLAGSDSLILLDEAHCARPFGQTVNAIVRYRTWADEPLPLPFQFVQMTATPPGNAPAEEVVCDEEDDRSHPVLGARIAASKPTRLVVAEKAKGKEWRRRLVDPLVQQAKGLMKEPVRAVGVIVNRVQTAREVHARLKEAADAVLLTGRMRPLDRDAVVARWLRRLESNAAEVLDRPVYVVATQCLEVGADLDFHALVSECASLDALRQRFGRLNRVARRDHAPGVIVIRGDQTTEQEDPGDQDPVYGNSLPRTWAWLRGSPPQDEVDMGVAAMQERLADLSPAKLTRMNAPALDAPVLLPAHLDCWVQTAPPPSPDPEPAVFLHGPERGIPDVQVVWRADLPENEELWQEAVSLCPPSAAEAMPVPLPVFRDWLAGQEQLADLSDVESEVPPEDEDEETAAETTRRALRWCGPDSPETMVFGDPREVRPGDTLVLPVAAGNWNFFGHVPSEDESGQPEQIDLGELAYQRSRNVAIVRLTPSVVAQWHSNVQTALTLKLEESLTVSGAREPVPESDGKRRGAALEGLGAALEDEAGFDNLLNQVLQTLGADPSAPTWLGGAAAALLEDRWRKVERHPAGGVVIKGSRRLRRHEPPAPASSEDDTASAMETSGGRRAIPLADHCQGVEQLAREFALAAGLPTAIVEALGWGGRLHDVGKADPRFQALLRNLPRRAVFRDATLLAKSATVPRSQRARQQARERSAYPPGARHELLSVRLAESVLEALPGEVDRELLLHLMASHHGHCRPFAPIIEDHRPETVEEFEHLGLKIGAASTATRLERLDSGVAERFWRLVRKYGWWGLAYLETILRLADHRRSEREQEEQDDELH